MVAVQEIIRLKAGEKEKEGSSLSEMSTSFFCQPCSLFHAQRDGSNPTPDARLLLLMFIISFLRFL